MHGLVAPQFDASLPPSVAAEAAALHAASLRPSSQRVIATAAYQARLPMPWITSWGAWAPSSPCLSLYVHVTAPYDEHCLRYFGHFLQQ